MIERFSTRALFSFLFSLVAAGTVFPLGSAYGAWLSGIGFLPGQSTSGVGGLSADGQVAVGGSGGQPIRWTRSGGISPLVAPSSSTFSGTAYGASRDGSVIVGAGGYSSSPSETHAFRWTASGMLDLGKSPIHSAAVGVSADGSAVVGTDCPDPGYAFYWTAPGPMVRMVETGQASGISDDGTVIVGQMSTGTVSFGTATKWTRNGLGGWEPTALLPPSGADVATDATPNGSVIVGFKGAAGFRWTASGVEHILDIPIQANAVSNNGTLIAGTLGAGPSQTGNEAYLWDSVNGARTVEDVLRGLGVTEVSGWQLTCVTDISGDGTIIAGLGVNPGGQPEGWVANVRPVPAPASVFIWLGLASLGVLWGRQGRRSKSAA